jgi:hypothetical protein
MCWIFRQRCRGFQQSLQLFKREPELGAASHYPSSAQRLATTELFRPQAIVLDNLSIYFGWTPERESERDATLNGRLSKKLCVTL